MACAEPPKRLILSRLMFNHAEASQAARFARSQAAEAICGKEVRAPKHETVITPKRVGALAAAVKVIAF